MKVNLFCFFALALFGCSTDYSDIKNPEFGVYYKKSLDEQLIILNASIYVHVYNGGRNRDTATYVFEPGIESNNYWGQIRFSNFNDSNWFYNNRRIVNERDSTVIYSFAYSPESFYTGRSVIVSDIDDVRNGFNLK